MIRRSPGHPLHLLGVFLLAFLAGACDTAGILEVDLPGRVVADDLDNAELADILVRSVISDLECSWSQYSAASSHHSDEYMNSSGNLWHRNWGQRRIEDTDPRFAQGECDDIYAFYQPLHTARYQAADVYARLNTDAFAEVPEVNDKLATLRAHEGYALVGLGEAFCEMSVPLEPGVPGPLMTPDEVLRMAEERFTEALGLAEQAGNDDIRNMARVGRARVRLDLEEFEGAIADASAVDEGYLRVATRGDESARRYNYNFNQTNSEVQARHATISLHYRDLTVDAEGRPTEGDGVPDPRVNAFPKNDLFGHNTATESWFHDKYTSRSSPMPIASWKEARLILAESYVRTGRLEEARALVNERRTELGLPTFDLPATESEMLELILEERRRDLFVEGGHRLNDMLRFRGTEHEIPFLGEPGSIHSDGLDPVGAAYGSSTCYPLPAVERIGNPNIPDS